MNHTTPSLISHAVALGRHEERLNDLEDNGTITAQWVNRVEQKCDANKEQITYWRGALGVGIIVVPIIEALVIDWLRGRH